MSLGKIARKLLGKKKFSNVAYYYRQFFVNLDLLALTISNEVSNDARILDIGGGDGAVLNDLLKYKPDIHVTMVDVAHSIGDALTDANRLKIRLVPNLSTFDNHPIFKEKYEAILISDVIHHINENDRSAFFRQLFKTFEINSFMLIVKDIEPGYIKSYLSWLSDRLISGDPNTKLISQNNMINMIMSETSNISNIKKTDLFDQNRPNYCIVAHVSSEKNEL